MVRGTAIPNQSRKQEEFPAMIYLYVKIHNKTGLKYLGKTIKDPYKYKGSGIIWSKHIKKYGYDVTTNILLATENKNEIKEIGIFYSKLWNVVESAEWANLTVEEGQGGNTWNKKGRIISETAKMKMSKTRKGLLKSEETKLKMKKPKSEEHKKKIGLSNKGNIRPTIVCENCNKEVADITYYRWHGKNCHLFDS